MGPALLTIDLDAVAANWRALDRLGGGAQTGAVVKADAYGLGAAPVATRLAAEGARTFFVGLAGEGAALRATLGPGPEIFVFAGHMAGETPMIRGAGLIPLLNSPEQTRRHLDSLHGHPFGIQLDTGMARLGFQAADFRACREVLLAATPRLIQSHLAVADQPGHKMNAAQLGVFRGLTDGIAVPRSLAATGGILLGPDYRFDMTRPGIGLFGGMPFANARPVVRLSVPVIQTRSLAPGATVGYGATWTAPRPSRIATIAAGYADGLIRAMGGRARAYAGATPCPVVGRVSMDLITVDVTGLGHDPESLDLIGPHQGVDDLAASADTIGYEILTSLGARFARRYTGANESLRR